MAAGMVSAAPIEHARYLQGSHGAKTLFVKATTLGSAEQAASEQARTQNRFASHAGEVYYKTGVREPAFRYVTTGRIVVRFVSGEETELKAFAAANGLEYSRSLGRGGRSAVFVNKSDRDDIAQSNALMRQHGVVSAEPDWVLPIKLY
ncbi:hypothetical protein LOH54_09005 [Sulfurimonas sp. HSL-3221]|uniref:hypothetical protein n=1 Tax=Thiomicrolovo sulfuroxydans TaxID=2894755 RepID=UPI001E418011|nr:hypothetical protein [Sulfurimonas sp. HSL-3221]UFS61795.1 hypothetical protein LOH54_09005 [Sulfurimonas sp. HSL-3221]